MYCTNCGKLIDDDSNFCIQCGNPIKNVRKFQKDTNKYLHDGFSSIQENNTVVNQINTEIAVIEKATPITTTISKEKKRTYDENYELDTRPSLVGLIILIIWSLFILLTKIVQVIL